MAIKLPWEGLLTAVVDRAGGIIDKLVKDKDLAEQLKHNLSVQELGQSHEVQMAAIEADKAVELAVQETAQAEQQSNDSYTKRTRPKLARKSFNLAAFYTFWSVIDGFVIYSVLFWGMDKMEMSSYQRDTLMKQLEALQIDFNWGVFVGLASPVLAYMGIRGFEKWKNPGI